MSKDIRPDTDLCKELSRLTNINDHGKVYYLIADWCYKNCERATIDENCAPHFTTGRFKAAFAMFRQIFKTMNEAHEKIGHFPYGSLRYEVGKEMDDTIERCFGQKTLDAFNNASR